MEDKMTCFMYRENRNKSMDIIVHNFLHELCSKSLSHSIYSWLVVVIPLLDYCNPQYIG